MRVELTSSGLLPELMRELTRARCLVQQLGESRCRVVPLEPETEEEAALELTFFVTAWATRHGATVTLTR